MLQKGLKKKSFAAAVHREQITQVENLLNIPVDTFVKITFRRNEGQFSRTWFIDFYYLHGC